MLTIPYTTYKGDLSQLAQTLRASGPFCCVTGYTTSTHYTGVDKFRGKWVWAPHHVVGGVLSSMKEAQHVQVSI